MSITESQRGVYFECMEELKSTKYNMAYAVRLPANIDIKMFEQAVIKAAVKHPVFNATFKLQEDGPTMVMGDFPMTVSHTERANMDEICRSFLRPFDIENGPLYRFEICHIPNENIFLFDVCHLIFDGMSLNLFLNQIAYAYSGKDIPDEKLTQMDWADNEESLKKSEKYLKAAEFFKNKFDGVDFDNGIKPDIQEESENSVTIIYKKDNGPSSKKIDQFLQKNGLRASNLFTAAFAYAFRMFAGTNDSCFTMVSSGRHNIEDLSDSVGMFVKTLPLHIDYTEGEKTVDYIQRTGFLMKETVKNECISFSELVSGYGVNNDVCLIYQGNLLSEVELAGYLVRPFRLPVVEIPSKIACHIMKAYSGYELKLYYVNNLYSHGFMESLADTVLKVADEMCTSEYLEDITPASDASKNFIDRFNRTEAPFDESETVGSVFAKAALKNPSRIAVSFKDKDISYAEFDKTTKNIASYINSKGIGKDDFVAVYTPRDDSGVVSVWGVIRSGAAFQVLDPAYPAERLNFMIKDSRARLLIADRNLRPNLNEYEGEVLFTDEFSALPDGPDAGNAVAGNAESPDGALCIIYTSGTTGNPKGSVLENRNLVAFFHNHIKVMKIDENSKFGTYASFGFDAGVMDLVSTIMAGASLFIVPDEIRLDMASLEEFFCKNEITHSNMTTQVGAMFAKYTKCKSLKAIIVGGEKLVPFKPGDGFRFLNAYGPCETFGYISHHVVKKVESISYIGKPSDNIKLYVVDQKRRLLPVGAVGELCISGLQVGREYLGLPEKTADSFVPNPFLKSAGNVTVESKKYGRMYRTGDMVRLLPCGELEFIGRRDSQVKIRGFRVELTEVEEVIRRFEGIRDSAVAAFEDTNGGKYLAAYVVSNEPVDVGALKKFIENEKPAYMVPAHIMQLEKIPYNQNHKVNRRALPTDFSAEVSENFEKPSGDTEIKIADIFVRITGNENLGRYTDFMDAGLTSIDSLRFTVMLGEAFKRPVSLSDLRKNNCVRKLALSFDSDKEIPARDSGPSQNDYPLMQNQMGVFVESQGDEASVKYNIPLLLKVSDELDVDRLKAAFEKALDAHPYLKATLKADKFGEIRACRNYEEARVSIVKLAHLPEADRLVKPFKLLEQNLFRAQIIVTNDGNYLFLDVHHILSDGTSLRILLEDISAAYEGKALSVEEYSGFETARDEENMLKSGKIEEDKKYFENLLSGCNTECLPVKAPSRSKDEAGSLCHRFSFGKESSKITEYCRQNNLTANAFFNAVFGFTLSEYIHNDEVTYCTIYNGRSDSRLARSFGMFVRTIPVRTVKTAEPSPCPQNKTAEPSPCPQNKTAEPSPCLGFVRSVQRQLMDTMFHDGVSFAALSREYGLSSDIFFNYQGDAFEFNSLAGKEAELEEVNLSDAKAPLSVEVFLKNGEYSGVINSRSNYYCREFMEIFSDSLKAAALSFTECEKLEDVSILSKEEREASYEKLNDTQTDFEKIPAYIFVQRVAKESPDKTAVKTKRNSLTFRELEEKSNAVGNSLKDFSIRQNEIVGLILDRNELVPVTEIGVMKSGGAFLPMLPTYPDDRIDFCLRDAGCRFLITTEAYASSHKELLSREKPYRVLLLEELLLGETTPLWNSPDLSSLVYCIYTSGSTGTPKGVMIEHHNLSNFVQTASISEVEKIGSTILCMASISFDMSITEMFYSLCQGNTIYIATEEEIHNLDLLKDAFVLNNVDIMMMTPSFAWSLLSIPEFERALANLKGIVLGAEAFKPVLFDKLRQLNPEMVIQNGYGPTECTQVCSLKTVTSPENITIGKPFPNVKFYVLDSRDRLLPRYALGELVICGEGVGRGYVKLPEKNTAAFTEIDSLRGYRSGDLVRINHDNEIEFGGRNDNQVKIRGFRIELGEIENVMQEFDGITQSKVTVRNNGSGDFLAGFYTADKDIPVEELSAFLKKKLTYYMVPQALMQLEKMPLTQNGKLDARALPEIKPYSGNKKGHRGARRELQKKITDIFIRVLGIDECYEDDNFFEIGGTSLAASKVVMMLKSDGYKIEYQDIFDYQSADELASYLEGQGTVNRSSGKTDSPGHGFGPETDDKYIPVLKYNSLEYAKEVKRDCLGNVLLTGAVGFLGIHILKTLLETEKGKVICIVRKGTHEDVLTRLKGTLVYYFEDDYADAFKDRIVVIEGDITDDNLSEQLKDVRIDTIINCAASVKHYANDNSIEFVNVHGVENLIALANVKKARMIQISTSSVPGAHTDETYLNNVKMNEKELFVIDDMNNQYIKSKYQAELLMLDAIKRGMRGKIIRVGNLMGRYEDGEFQNNMHTNAFLNGLRGFVAIGKFPISHSTDPMSFSPVDCTAKAVVLLAGTNDMFTAFHAESRSTFDEMKVFDAINRCGIDVHPVSDEEYYGDFNAMMADPGKNEKVRALLTNDRPDMHMVEADNRFTANVLYRLGFSWPFIDDAYLEKVISSLDSLDFFDLE